MQGSRPGSFGDGITVRSRYALIAAAIFFVLPSANAQSERYPSRPVSLVVPYGPGSANDLLARKLAPELAANLRQSVVVENKPGAGGSLGTAVIAKAKPDGYTIGMAGSATMGVNPNLYSSLPYDVRKDLAPLVKIATTPNVLVVPAQSEITTLPEFMARMKVQRLRYASLGNGTTQHLASTMLARQVGTDADHIPYRSAGDALTALLSAQVDFAFYPVPSIISYIRDGRVRAVAATSPSADLPDVPALETAGLKDFRKVDVWFGLAAPAGLPAAVAKVLHEALEKTLSNPATQTQLRALGYTLSPVASQAEFSEFVADQLSFWGELIKVSGTRIE